MKFIVLPDGSAGESIAEAIQNGGGGDDVVTHPSGRPWIVGTWHAHELITTIAGDRKIALLGCALVNGQDLTDTIGRVRDLGGLDRIARTVPGAFHLLASFNGQARVQGNISGTHQIFHAQIGPTTIAADSPHSLSRLTGACVDDDIVAQHLLSPLPPWPLYDRCLWSGVHRLAADSYLELTPNGGPRLIRWWTPPSPETSASEGAVAVRSALTDAVAARTGTGGTVSADLSGGMDSTSICFLASDSPAHLVTARITVKDPSNDDGFWAGRAAAELVGAEHRVLPRERLPMNFFGLTEPDPDAEAPFAWLRVRGQFEHQARESAAWGANRHLTGHGGDELFMPLPGYDHTLVRTHPIKYLRRLGAQRALRRWRLGNTVKELLDGGSYARWLETAAESVTEPEPPSWVPSMAWSSPPVLAPWTTDEAVHAVRRCFRRAATAHPEPLSPLRGQHQFLQGVHQCAEALRRADRLTTRFGVTWHAPYLDSRVVEATMSIRLEDHCDPRRYKPVLADAMRGVVPADILGRQTKGEFSEDVYAGLHRNHSELLTLTEDMRLERRGLVDASVFRSALVGPHPYSRNIQLLLSTLACEVWLRSIEQRSQQEPGLVSPGGMR